MSKNASKNFIKHIKGSGTNFHKIYNSSPEIYHAFSLAEDSEDLIFNEIKKILNKMSEPIVLDVGCGSGKYAEKMNSYAKKVFYLDPSKEFIGMIRKRNINGLHPLLGFAEKIPLGNLSVDFTLSTWASYHYVNALREMKRVTKKGGMIMRVATHERDELTSLYPKFNERLAKYYAKYFQSRGFDLRVREITISFESKERAAGILREITGVRDLSLHKKDLKHKVAIQIYKKDD